MKTIFTVDGQDYKTDEHGRLYVPFEVYSRLMKAQEESAKNVIRMAAIIREQEAELLALRGGTMPGAGRVEHGRRAGPALKLCKG